MTKNCGQATTVLLVSRSWIKDKLKRRYVTDPLSGQQWRIIQDDVRGVSAGMDDQPVHGPMLNIPGEAR